MKNKNTKEVREPTRIARRDILRAGLILGGAAMIGPNFFGSKAAFPKNGSSGGGGGSSDGTIVEVYPTSPFILEPFTEKLPVPRAFSPEDANEWRDPKTGFLAPPGPGAGQQSSKGTTHQIWTSDLGFPDPITYRIFLRLRSHGFTSSRVRPIDDNGREVVPPDGIRGPRFLPPSSIYGFNGVFPGPMLNLEYGRPALVRFENQLDQNPFNLDRQDFGAPDLTFITHLHNGHTASESDGNPFQDPDGYFPQQYVDNLYLMFPAGFDEREKQSFLWFHDHKMDHTSANVYKGMVGIAPHYDPILDSGDETRGLRLPGVRRNNPDGTFDVDFDIPLVFYDMVLDDGVTIHKDAHAIGRGATHPEWWGQLFYQHFPNHGFVGDIFTVNGKAFPFLEVKRRKYRFRFLDASVSRVYKFRLMRGTPSPEPGSIGQWQLPDGEQCMKFTQIASEGGLLPAPIVRNAFELWPAKRREMVVDFTRYMDGSPTQPGDVVYLVNTLDMENGRKPDFDEDDDLETKVPVLKFIIGEAVRDDSVIPARLRDLPPRPSGRVLDRLPHRRFTFERSGKFGEEEQWLINGLPFDPLVSLADPKRGAEEVWTFENGGGGWVHPVHIHQEEHQVISRDGVPAPDARHPDDRSKEDVVALDPGEEVLFFRRFRDFKGKYVAHCHNLSHEDHAMMFGWEIRP